MTLRPIVLVAVTAGAVLLSGCAPAADGAEVTLEFQTGMAASAPALKALTSITQQCAPDGVRIDLVPQTNTYEADMKARLASADIPDLWATHGWSLLRYSEFLEPLQDRPWAAHVNPVLAPAMRGAGGELYALPINTDIAGIVYNERTIRDAGIDLESLTDWDSFTEALATLDAAGKTPLASSGKDTWLAGNVADFMASGAHDEAARGALSAGRFAREDYGRLLTLIDQWSDEGFFNPDFTSASFDDLARGMATGEVGFVFVQNYFVSTVLDFAPDAELGYFPIPSFDGDPYFVGGEGTAFGVSATAPEKDAALEYLDCLAEPEHIGALARTVGGIPGRTDAPTDLGPLQDSYDRWVEGDAYRLEPYFDRVHLPNGMWNTMSTTAVGVIAGESTVAEALDQLEQQYDALSAR